MYDSFDNTYQATIGIDFLSKARTFEARSGTALGVSGRIRMEQTRLTTKLNNADHVPRRPNGAVTALGHSRSGAIQELDPLLHPGLERSGGSLRHLKYGQPSIPVSSSINPALCTNTHTSPTP